MTGRLAFSQNIIFFSHHLRCSPAGIFVLFLPMCSQETEVKEKAPPVGNIHATIPSPPPFPPFRILDRHKHTHTQCVFQARQSAGQPAIWNPVALTTTPPDGPDFLF